MTQIENLFGAMRAAASGLSAERIRIDVIASNIANAQTTGESGPYLRKRVHFEPMLQKLLDGSTQTAGVRVTQVSEDRQTPTERVYDPRHPYSDADGFVELPNVNPTLEMADLITALRAYDANLRVQEAFVDMAERALALASA